MHCPLKCQWRGAGDQEDYNAILPWWEKLSQTQVAPYTVSGPREADCQNARYDAAHDEADCQNARYDAAHYNVEHNCMNDAATWVMPILCVLRPLW